MIKIEALQISQLIGCCCAIIGVFVLALPVPIVLNR